MVILVSFIPLIIIKSLAFADERYIPEWDAFFEKLSQTINEQDSRHKSVLVDVIKDLGQPTQLPVEYPEQVALYDADLVEPLVSRGFTDANTVAERQELLNLRATSANLLRLKGKPILVLV